MFPTVEGILKKDAIEGFGYAVAERSVHREEHHCAGAVSSAVCVVELEFT